MAYEKMALNAVDLFCGAGGLSLGLEHSGIHVQLGIEINSIAANTYQKNLPGYVLVDDIRSVSSQTIMDKIHARPRELFLLAGCPPCQTFSSLQKDDVENDERNNLIFEYVRIARDLQPLFVQLENVPGLKQGKGKNIFRKAMDELSEYYALTSNILNCADYGIPQKRRRLVLHGIRKDAFQLLKSNDPTFEISLPTASHTAHPTGHDGLKKWVPASVAFVNLPPVNAGDPAPKGYPNHETNKLSETNIKRIIYIQQHGGSRNCLPQQLQLPCHQKDNVSYTGVYGVIDPNQPAPTMTGGCITYSKGRYGHPNQPRAITVREAARLQSFPDNYVFTGTKCQAALQVGNAVPPLLAQLSGLYFIQLLNKLHSITA